MKNNIDLVSKYLKIYDEHYYKGSKDIIEIHYLVNTLSNYKDKLDTLSEDFIIKLLDKERSISSYKERMGIDELIILLDKNKLEFDNRYCYCMHTIMETLLYYHEKINNKELNEIAINYGQVKFGFEGYISESYEFRTFIKELGQACGYNFKTYLYEVITHLGAYIYYNSLDPELLRDLSITFMCNYEEVIDILRMNGFTLFDNIDNDYLNHLCNLILSVGYNHKTTKRGLS